MEEQLMFTRVHDALDIPTPPGAYERLRTELTRKPVQPRSWPALRIRTSTMGFRLAAGLVVVAIAVAAGVAALAIHNSTNNVSPAGSRMSIQAYQKMIEADRPDPNSVWAQCDDAVHTGCLRSAQQSLPLIQKWLRDITNASPPARFAVVNAEMQRHLAQNIDALNALVVDSQAKNDAVMSQDFDVAVYAVDWTQVMNAAIAQSQEATASSYKAILRSEVQTLDGCGAACGFGTDTTHCMTSSGLNCIDYFSKDAVSFGPFQADLIQHAAPPSLAAQDVQIQNDLARADAALLAMNLAMGHKDQAGFNSAMAQIQSARVQIDTDAAKITG